MGKKDKYLNTENVVFKIQKITFVNTCINSIAMGLIRMRNFHYVEQGMWLKIRRTMLKSRLRN